MTVRLIGAGFGRTGTTSLKAALEMLGYSRCYHMQEVFRNPRHAELWQQAGSGERVDWDQLFDGYSATVDWPGCTHYQQLMETYPDAKVLLSVRDPERWYRSCRASIYALRTSLFVRILKVLSPRVRRIYRMIDDQIWQGTFDERFEDRKHATGVFEAHNESVQNHVPADRLLVYEVKEGWEPLCKFLDVPVPDVPFPHLNDKKMMQNAMRFGPVLLIGGLIGIVATAVWLLVQFF